MSLNGCSNVTKTKEVAVLPPDSILVDPCQGQEEFNTPRELGRNQLHNLACIDQYGETLKAIRDWKKAQAKLYGVDLLKATQLQSTNKESK